MRVSEADNGARVTAGIGFVPRAADIDHRDKPGDRVGDGLCAKKLPIGLRHSTELKEGGTASTARLRGINGAASLERMALSRVPVQRSEDPGLGLEQVSGADDSETDDSETDADDDGLGTTCTLLTAGPDHDVSHKAPRIYMNVNQTLCMMHYKKM